MLLALARCVYELYYETEWHRVKGTVWTFGNRCTSDLEAVASVLEKAGFISNIDGIGRRSAFNCQPGDFEGLANLAELKNLPDKGIEETVTRLAESNYRSSLEIEWLAEQIATAPKLRT